MPNDREPWGQEWREVQDHRYDKGFYPGSGKINPFFRRMGKPDRRFGIQALVIGIGLAVAPLVFAGARRYLVFLLVLGAVLIVAGIGNIAATRRAR